MPTHVEIQLAVQRMRDNHERWHPSPPEPLTCSSCGVQFVDRLRKMWREDGSVQSIIIPARVFQQIHDAAYSYAQVIPPSRKFNIPPGVTVKHVGMCGMPKDQRLRIMADAKMP